MGQAVRLPSPGPEAPASFAELRAAPRRAIDLPARLVFSDLSRSFDVRLCDIAAGGVRLRLPAGTVLPKHAYLMVRDDSAAGLLCLACETRWQVSETAGLRFLPSADPAVISALLDRAAS